MEPPSTEAAQVDAQSEEWFASYVDASSRPSTRHRRFRHRSGRDPRRQRIDRLNNMMMLVSVAFLGAMTAGFYVLLTR